MKSKYIIITVLTISLVISIIKISSVDKKNKELVSTISALERKIDLTEVENQVLKEKMKPEELTYIGYDHKYRFVEKEIKVYQSPEQEYSKINTISANTSVRVEDAVQTMDGTIWLFVEVPPTYEPRNTKGWIREKDTLPITKENQSKIINITVEKGAEVYYMAEFKEIKNMKPNILDRTVEGYIGQKSDGYVEIHCVGGMDILIEEKYVVYPPLSK